VFGAGLFGSEQTLGAAVYITASEKRLEATKTTRVWVNWPVTVDDHAGPLDISGALSYDTALLETISKLALTADDTAPRRSA